MNSKQTIEETGIEQEIEIKLKEKFKKDIGYFGYPCICKHPLDYAIISATEVRCLVCDKIISKANEKKAGKHEQKRG